MPMALTQRVAATWAIVAVLPLGGCGLSPYFVHEPPASYRVPLPAEIQGIWAREGKDNGERAQIVALVDGTVRIDIFKLNPPAQDKPPEPVFVRALRFDDTDWLLVDLSRLAAREGSQYTGTAPYKLVKYSLEDSDRLCGIEPSASLFAKAIESGQLQGSVKSYAGPMMHVTVTSTGEEWVKWWSGLPSSQKMFAQPVFCFHRMN